MNLKKRLAFVPLLAVALAVAAAFTFGSVSRVRAQVKPAEPRHVIMISIDGLKPETYTKPGPSKVPTLRRLAKEGVFAEGVIGVTPTVTYPSHTAMITGVLPAVHGIPANTILDPSGTSNGEWYRFARDIKTTTLPGVVKARGLKTAGVFWPVSVGMESLDFNVPEVAYYTNPKMMDLLRELSFPRNIIDSFEIASGKPLVWPMTDDDRVALAIWFFKTQRPHLTLLHIFNTDSQQHNFGPNTPEALKSIEEADAHVQMVLDAVKETGLQDRTDIVIVSDHGFLPVEKQLQLNALFKQEKLLEVNPETNRITKWDVYFHANGGSGFVYLKNPDDAALRDRVAGLLKKVAADPANGVETVWDREALAKAGADPRASFGVDMKSGFYSNGAHDVLVKQTSSKGGHGFAPTRPELHASLIMAGPDVPKTGSSLGVVRMTQIAPTIASWFGVTMSPQVDQPLAFAATRSSGSR
jgi:predicted AlkP superfamily pyrophosphatase or phosphodiesterase